PRDRVGYFRRKYAVDRAAVVTEPAQRGLHCADITRLHNQLLRSLKVVKEARMISWCEVRGVHNGVLMKQTPFVSLGQWIGRTKKRTVRRVRRHQTESQREPYEWKLHKIDFTTNLSPRVDRAAVTVFRCSVEDNPRKSPGRARRRSVFFLLIFDADGKDRVWSA